MNPALEQHPLMHGLNDAERTRLLDCAEPHHYAVGTPVLRQGQAANRLVLITAGRVEVRLSGAGARVTSLETLGPGETLGWSWYVPPGRWQFDSWALEATDTLEFEAGCLRSAMSQEHAITEAVLGELVHTLAHRLTAARLRLLDLYANPGS